jgi:hypothetical protein
MILDVNAQVVAGVVGTVITTLGLIIVAVLNNRRERKGSAEASMEATLRERILFKEEIIADLRNDKQELIDQNTQLRQDKADLKAQVRRLESIERRHGRDAE